MTTSDNACSAESSAELAPLCGLVEASCECEEEQGHDGPHLCRCGGSWDFDEDGFVFVAAPGTAEAYVL